MIYDEFFCIQMQIHNIQDTIINELVRFYTFA